MTVDYKRLSHALDDHNDWFVVNWCLGNTCNFKCSYCPTGLHDASVKWPELNTIIGFISKVKKHFPQKKLYFEFTGGEVTHYKHFLDVCKFCKDNDVRVGLITNGSKKIDYWEASKQYFDHICLSFHPEFADPEHFFNVVKTIRNDLRTHVNIMMKPENFDECYEIANKIKNLGNISMALQPLIVDFGDTLYNYDKFQKNIIDKQFELITKFIKFDRNFDYYRGAMKRVVNEKEEVITAQSLINSKENDWSGWSCNAGIEQLVIDMDGSVYRGWCKVGGCVGNISDENLVLPSAAVICNKTMCHCNFDIMCTKEKI